MAIFDKANHLIRLLHLLDASDIFARRVFLPKKACRISAYRFARIRTISQYIKQGVESMPSLWIAHPGHRAVHADGLIRALADSPFWFCFTTAWCTRLRGTADNWSKDRFLIAGEDHRARKRLYDALIQYPQNLKVAGELEHRPSPPTVTRLRQIKVPTLILVGEADIGDVFAFSGAIQASAPLASFEIWKDTGHLIQLQSPTRLVTRFKDFVALADRRDVHVDASKLAEYVGAYDLSNSPVKVLQKEGHLVLEIPGQPYYWLFAASDTKFFLRTENTEIDFRVGRDGRVAEMTIHNSDGSEIQCPRLHTLHSISP